MSGIFISHSSGEIVLIIAGLIAVFFVPMIIISVLVLVIGKYLLYKKVTFY